MYLNLRRILFVSGQTDGIGTLHGTSTPCGSHRSPPLPATAHSRVWLLQRSENRDKCIFNLICGSSPQACHSLLCANRLLALFLPSLSGSWPAQSHTAFPSGRISNVSEKPYSIPRLLPACGNVPQIETHSRQLAAEKARDRSVEREGTPLRGSFT